MESSCTICRATTRKPDFFRTSATAGPERSARSPRAQESLTVTTAAVKITGSVSSAIEEDIFFLFRPPTGSAATRTRAGHTSAGPAARTGDGSALNALSCGFRSGLRSALALRFVEQPQALHQQTLSVELRGFLIGLALEVEFEVAAGPTQNLEDGFISRQSSVSRVLDLTFHKKHFALLALIVQLELAALASHFKRLHQVYHIHLREVPAHHAIGRRGLSHLFESDTVHGTLDAPRSFFQEERFGDVVVGRILRR